MTVDVIVARILAAADAGDKPAGRAAVKEWIDSFLARYPDATLGDLKRELDVLLAEASRQGQILPRREQR